MRRLLLFALSTAMSGSVAAHEDTRLRRGPAGKLYGLPEEYRPAAYSRATMTLTVGRQRYTVPKFLRKRIRRERCFKVKFDASWYHWEGEPYISLRFRNVWGNGYDVGFLLDDLSAVGVMDITRQGRGYRSDHLELSDEQRAALKAGSARGGR